MDELKPSPRNELLYGLAQKLRSAPAKLSKANPVLGRLSEMVLGDIPKGLEHWAYGDSPLGPPANAPMFNERALPMLEAAPIGALGAATKGAALAQLVPARPLLNADALAASRLSKRIAQADDAMMQGANAKDIWEFFGLQKAPGAAHVRQTGKIGPDSYQTRWLEEINPENKLLKGFDPTRIGESPIDKVFDSPELFRQYPQLREMTVDITDGKLPEGNLGEFQFLKNRGAGKLVMPNNAQDPAGTLTHELSHGVMHNLRQGSSVGYGGGHISEPMRGALGDVGAYLESMPGSALDYGKVPEQLYRLSVAPNGRTTMRNGTWDLSAGETLAETARHRSGTGSLSEMFRKTRAPEEDYPVANPLNDILVERAARIARTGAPIEYQTQTLVRMLRDFGVIPK